MSKKIIKDFLLDKRSYLKCGTGRISEAIFAKKGIITTASEIKEVKKQIRKGSKKQVVVDDIVVTAKLIEDFRDMAEKLNFTLSGTPFAPTEKILKRKGPNKDYTVPDFSDQKGMHILLGCNHVPFHHVQLHEGIKQLIVDYNKDIKGFHLMGDFMDINTLSSHDKGRFSAVPGLTLDDEYSAGNELLDEFDAVLPKDCWKTYLYGNHEDRWSRWMKDMQNAKTPLESPEEALELWDRVYQVKTSWSHDYFTLGANFDIFHGIYFSIHCAKAHLDKLGHTPLPKYINRPAEDLDKERYQTIYASEVGAVAAPTAGLHMSPEVMKRLEIKGINFARLTLHVGLGTFRNIEVEDLSKHKMDAEYFKIDQPTCDMVNSTIKAGGRRCAVGTTSMRSIESAVSAHEMLKPAEGWTNKFIFPPYNFSIADSMITNFHLPKSSLAIMVCAFGGYDLIMEAYEEAIREEYRFFSYGDAMLII